MRVSFNETDSTFWLTLVAETMEEAGALTRFGINGRQLEGANTGVSKDGVFTSDISFRKAQRDATNYIPSGSKARRK
jgi:hypothetical protein